MIPYFVRHKALSAVFALSLCVTTTNYACNTQAWLNVIGQYLPLAIQIAKSIASLIVVFNPSASQEDQSYVTTIGDEATRDYQLLQSLYQQYKATPSATTEAAIENTLTLIVQNLPQILNAGHVKDPSLQGKLSSAVNILITIADAIVSQMPVKSPTLRARKNRSLGYSPSAVKVQWDTLVCSGNATCTAMVHP